MSGTRERISSLLEDEPGAHFRAIVRDLDLAQGQVQYHLRRLRRSDQVVREEYQGRTHYFPPGYDAAQRRAIAVVRRETARDVLVVLLEASGPVRPATVADDLAIARSTLEWHLDGLLGVDLVEKRPAAGNRVALAVPDPERAARLLATVEPTVPDRLVDRFTRLVDDLL